MAEMFQRFHMSPPLEKENDVGRSRPVSWIRPEVKGMAFTAHAASKHSAALKVGFQEQSGLHQNQNEQPQTCKQTKQPGGDLKNKGEDQKLWLIWLKPRLRLLVLILRSSCLNEFTLPIHTIVKPVCIIIIIIILIFSCGFIYQGDWSGTRESLKERVWLMKDWEDSGISQKILAISSRTEERRNSCQRWGEHLRTDKRCSILKNVSRSDKDVNQRWSRLRILVTSMVIRNIFFLQSDWT